MGFGDTYLFNLEQNLEPRFSYLWNLDDEKNMNTRSNSRELIQRYSFNSFPFLSMCINCANKELHDDISIHAYNTLWSNLPFLLLSYLPSPLQPFPPTSLQQSTFNSHDLFPRFHIYLCIYIYVYICLYVYTQIYEKHQNILSTSMTIHSVEAFICYFEVLYFKAIQ